MKYRKKSVVIDAWQFTRSCADIPDWVDPKWIHFVVKPDGPTSVMRIPTLEGTMTANFGDFIIQGVHGECYPCKPDIFYAIYEAVP